MRVGLTTGARRNPLAALLLWRLAEAGYAPVLVLSTAPPPGLARLAKARRLGLAWLCRRLQERSAEAPGRAAPSPITVYARQRGYADPFQPLPALCRRLRVAAARVPDLAGPEAVAAVVEAGVGLLINAGGGLFREPLIAACPAGILNAHMGPLPRVRGMNALEWSLLEGLPPTATLHFVAAGIDTGDLLGCQPIPVEPGDTIAALRQRYVPVAVELVAAHVAAIAAGTAARRTQRAVEGRQYFALHPQLWRLAEARLRGLAAGPARAGGV